MDTAPSPTSPPRADARIVISLNRRLTKENPEPCKDDVDLEEVGKGKWWLLLEQFTAEGILVIRNENSDVGDGDGLRVSNAHC
jgi:hypothetical protein